MEYEEHVAGGRPEKKFLKDMYHCEKCKVWKNSGHPKNNITRHYSIHGDSNPGDRRKIREAQDSDTSAEGSQKNNTVPSISLVSILVKQ